MDHHLQYPTVASMHRPLTRACQSSALPIEAEARLMRAEQSESPLYCSLISEAKALEREAQAHIQIADTSEADLLKRK
ncbi:MAG: hypothetical protein KGS72_26310 [Cyanobacteria bacterium REEB67]|nr:hypothetical protein [Cyanobacteria bacterium REEB67]